MKNKSIFKLSYLAIFVMLLLQSCEQDDPSFGKDLEVHILPTEISYPEILNAREFSKIESAVPFMNANGHPVIFEVLYVKKEDEILDASYLNSVSISNFSVIESEINDQSDEENSWTVYTNDLSEIGKITIADGNPFGYGEYFFTINAAAKVDGGLKYTIFEDALRLKIGPELTEGIAYCPFNMNFVSGENTTSNPVELFGGNSDVRYELGTESDKLAIDAATGAISLNSSYTVGETEIVKPTINVISNVSDEVVSFEEKFTATLSTTPVELDKDSDYFFFPTLKATSKNNVALGGNGYSRVFVEHQTTGSNPKQASYGVVSHIKAGDPEETSNWFITKALWRNHKNSPIVNTPDAVEVRADAGVTGTQTIEHQMWTITGPSESWIIMDPQNLSLYEGCFDSKAVFWYKIHMSNAGYEADGSTPIDLEVKISNDYTGDVTSTTWTPVNDILECEINDNGTIINGTPYPGDQTGVQPPNGIKDPTNSPNNLWVRAELNLENYKDQESFTLAFRFKTQYEDGPYYVDNTGGNSDGWNVLNGSVRISNVHFVATEK